MDITERDLQFLRFVAEHYTVTAEHLRANVSPDNSDTTVIRRRLRLLHEEGLIGIARAEAITANNSIYAQVYHPSEKGMELLARRTGEMQWLLTPTKPPFVHHLAHFLALTDLRLLTKKAISAESMVTLGNYYNQFDTVNADAEDPAERFKLYTTVRTEPRRVACIPDAAFALTVGTITKAYYVELERGTTLPGKAAAKKSPGYAGLFESGLHRTHFPDAMREFAVLVLAPHPGWRKQLQREFGKKAHPELYKFATMTEVTPASLLFDPIWHSCEGETHALLKGPKPRIVPKGSTRGVPEGVSGGMPRGMSEGVPPGTPEGT